MNSGTNLRPAIFLDRDGVINEMIYNPDFGLVDSPQSADQFSLLPNVAQTIRSINDLGVLAVVISNQPGIAKGKCTPQGLDLITEKMYFLLANAGARLDAVYYCLHHPEAQLAEYRVVCDCRKPKPGLILKAARELGIDLGKSFMIGDGLTDILAGQAVGCTTILIGKYKCYVCQRIDELGARPGFCVADLPEAARLIREQLASCQLSERAN